MGESTKVDNDLRENPEYNELENKVSYKLPFKKENIKNILNNAKVIEEQEFYKNFNGDEAIIGSKVPIKFNDLYFFVFYLCDENFQLLKSII